MFVFIFKPAYKRISE